MMPTFVQADLTELLGYLGGELAHPQGDLRVVLLHAMAELARLLRDDLHDEDWPTPPDCGKRRAHPRTST
ncbi:unnamed protein product [[Actinomadura] parvosata subsp. kistnae]|uniref:Uncharacterized protein n=1 Tax=[Actinomadura] parvosata subsp. kistnae TaxID=1909395 RepID=A0A1U9ZYC7_9ACTN|nr:hypothetical protein BKM31_17180 [Nonomuraea sp. ATCC 55076]SPL95733.1 unnamed protein product [Actinomadura parvosata subsp. kistnae]